MRKYVIIGNGVAGATAAEKIKAGDPGGSITIYTDEPVPFYYRVRLPDVIAGQVDLAKITLRTKDWYDQQQITLYLGEAVSAVDPDKRLVIGNHGHRSEFDALLLAGGAKSFVPPEPGADKAGVFALRNYEDARLISEKAGMAKEAILIGGGLLGLEAGHGLIRRGIKVQVVEFFDRLLPRQMDAQGAAKLQARLEQLGFSFFLGAKSKEITGDKTAAGLALEDGRTLPGDLILFSAGIRPNLDLPKTMGLDVDKGVKVDDRLLTSHNSIWAAGDLIEHRGRIYGIWPAAKDQGEVAGVNMAGGSAVYEGTIMSNSLKVVGLDLTSAGNIDADGKLEAAIWEDDDNYRKIVLENGRVAGFIFFGAKHGVKECQSAMEKGLDVGRFSHDLGQKDFDFSRLV